MHGKWFWLRPSYLVLVLPAVALLIWGMLGGGLVPRTPGAVARGERTGAAPVVVAASASPAAASVRWCDEGLGCNDAQ